MSGEREIHPTGETVRASTPREVLATIAGILLLVLLADAGATVFFARRPVNLGYRVIKEKWQLLLAQRAPADWLVLGDSSGNQGVVPGALGRALGGRALNLCTIGALGVWNDAWMLETHIARLGPPRHLVLVHVYQVWEESKNVEALAEVPLPFGYWRGLNPVLPLSAAEEWRFLLDRYAPLYSQDRGLATLVQYPWRVFGAHFTIGPEGFMPVARATPDVVRADADSHREYIASHPFAVSETNRVALEGIGTLAERHDFDVYLALGPVFEGLAADPEYRRRLADLEAALRQAAERHPRIHLLGLTDPVTFPADRMQNADHVTVPAAEVYTAALARRIESALER